MALRTKTQPARKRSRKAQPRPLTSRHFPVSVPVALSVAALADITRESGLPLLGDAEPATLRTGDLSGAGTREDIPVSSLPATLVTGELGDAELLATLSAEELRDAATHEVRMRLRDACVDYVATGSLSDTRPDSVDVAGFYEAVQTEASRLLKALQLPATLADNARMSATDVSKREPMAHLRGVAAAKREGPLFPSFSVHYLETIGGMRRLKEAAEKEKERRRKRGTGEPFDALRFRDRWIAYQLLILAPVTIALLADLGQLGVAESKRWPGRAAGRNLDHGRRLLFMALAEIHQEYFGPLKPRSNAGYRSVAWARAVLRAGAELAAPMAAAGEPAADRVGKLRRLADAADGTIANQLECGAKDAAKRTNPQST